MKNKPDLDRAKKSWQAFWEKEVLDRPPVAVTAPKIPISPPSFDDTPVRCFNVIMSGAYDPFLQSFTRAMEATHYAGEAIPHLNAGLGPDQYAGFYGCEILAPAGHETTWARPIVTDWKDFTPALDRSPGSFFQRLQDFLAYATDFAQGEFIVGQQDLHSNMDALSALRGPQELCFDLMDDPDTVLRVRDSLDDGYPEIFSMIYNAGGMERTGSIGWAPTYCEKGRFAVIQCDFSILLSPRQARQFVIPSIRREAAYLDRCVYHYDGKEALGHLEDILAIEEIDCIQWVPGDGQPRTLFWMDLLQKIQKAGKSLWIYDWSVEEIKRHFKQLDPARVFFSVCAADAREADELLAYLVKHM